MSPDLRVLIVEDDPNVRLGCTQALKRGSSSVGTPSRWQMKSADSGRSIARS